MKIFNETNNFYEIKKMLWGGAEDVLQQIDDVGQFDTFDDYINDIYPDGIDITSLNDMLRFDRDQIFKDLGIVDEEVITQIENLINTINNAYKNIKKDKDGIINQIKLDDGDAEEAEDLLDELDYNVERLNEMDIDNDTEFIDLEELASNLYFDLEKIEDYDNSLEIICNSARELEKLAQDAQ